MTSPGGRAVVALLGLLLVGCSPGRGPLSSGAGNASPSPAPRPPVPGPAVASSPSPGAGGGLEQQPPAGGLFGSPPATNASSTTLAAPAPGRADPAGVARAYATGLYTVDWTRPVPGDQKLAAAAPWATPSVAAKLARGQHYQPARSDPRVAAGQVDTVERVVIEEADPVTGGAAYLVTIDIRTSSAYGVTTTQAFLLLTVIRQAGGWLVDDSRVVG